MTDRWARAEERFRQREAERRYRRDDRAWGREARDNRESRGRVAGPEQDAWAEYEDDTTVIPRYTDEDEGYAGHHRRSGRREPDYDSHEYDSHEYDEYGEPEYEEPPARRAPARKQPRRGRTESRAGQPRKRSRMASRKAAERKRRRRNLWIVGAVFVLLFVAAAGFAALKLMKRFSAPEDYAGAPGPLVVVQVHPGDTSEQIAQTMLSKGVVASTGAFYEAALRNTNMNSVQPGFYAIPSHSQGAKAVAALVNKESRVGYLVISEGRQLHDQHDVKTGAPTEGIYRKIADASCIGAGADKKCVTYEQLDAAGAGTDLAALGVPNWAVAAVRAVPDRSRQLEGLIMAGSLDFDPSSSPQDILKQLITASAARYESTGLLQSGGDAKLNPYQMLTGASMIQREVHSQYMGKAARVIVNRLNADQKLEFDSTVNYALDRTEVSTSGTDRAKETPWNTYAMTGLPATPISSPSIDALKAMENPEPGKWLYFVTVDPVQGTTLFADNYAEHIRNVHQAEQSGILDSGR
ncbi:endolytic transglycosylase MltG [Nocardia arthritidis]|nr:endolytic transglycosylase MltG [Nocardia arthritidis]